MHRQIHGMLEKKNNSTYQSLCVIFKSISNPILITNEKGIRKKKGCFNQIIFSKHLTSMS